MIWWAFEKAALSERRAGTTTCPKQVAARALQWRAFWKEVERRCEAEEERRCEVDSLWWVEEAKRREADCQHSDRTERRWRRRTAECLRA